MTRAQDAALAYVRAQSSRGDAPETARLTINLHPDRIASDGRATLAALLDDGEVRTQFETGISAGGLDEVMGGARSRWEHMMFGGAYDHAAAGERPRYGALSLTLDPWGGCPRFGSSHLILRPHLRDRATFTWGDSATEPTAYGTWGNLGAVLMAARDEAWTELRAEPRPPEQLLDVYVEAQIHSTVRLDRDVQALVLDGSFRDTEIGGLGEAVARRHDVELVWAPAREVDADFLDPTFRTWTSPLLAMDIHRRLARTGQRLDAELIGRAAAEIVRSSGSGWEAYGDATRALQELKYLWHHLVAFGTPQDCR
ncbi:DUF3626 domain-containing protein [Demetria terragena]|uniref:DUF3626 domain-containing protein n=1 Tax=Demetria terragena TaxID=63959 RepID=UPI00037BB636|nr:DUF3626 domain-containing protein [Demetria terragena]